MGIEICIGKSLGSYKLDFQVESDARRFAILGASGSGKSLTLKCIAGIERPDRGRIVIDGKVLFDASSKINLPPRERKVGYLFQNYALFPTMTVEENIAVGIKDKKNSAEVIEKLVMKYNLQGLEKLYPRQLSGGQQQRVALARMMAAEPDVILLDEPFSALDYHLREEMHREMQKFLKDYPGIIILVSHDRDEVYRMSDELVVLHEGKSIARGGTVQLFEKPENVHVARLTGCKNVGQIGEASGLYVKAWDMNFPVIKSREGYAYVGFRAHHLRVEKPAGEPYYTIPVYQLKVEEGLWECTISFLASPKATEAFIWKISKAQWEELKNKNIKELYLLERDLLLLRK